MKNKIQPFFLSFFLFVTAFIVAGCTSSNDNSEPPSKDTQLNAINTVLEYQFTTTDSKIVELYYAIDSNEIDLFNVDSNTSSGEYELRSYLEKIYGPYFTEHMFNEFISDYGTVYHLQADGNGFKLKTDTIDIVQDKENENVFDFSVNVLVYQRRSVFEEWGSEPTSNVNVSGRAYFNHNKITAMQFLDISELDELLGIGRVSV